MLHDGLTLLARYFLTLGCVCVLLYAVAYYLENHWGNP